ncbi:MAG: right-handed parallel beta-helix repeat-containing protein [Clostridia bacterium]|nr:right-handed parallel beta-helix repeat-containing protein [Clostridia bacterium]
MQNTARKVIIKSVSVFLITLIVICILAFSLKPCLRFFYSGYIAPTPTFAPAEHQNVNLPSVFDLYVSTDGCDSNDGTISSPLLTIEAAAEKAAQINVEERTSIKIGVLEGKYYSEGISISRDILGGISCPIEFYALGNVTLSAGLNLSKINFRSASLYPDFALTLRDGSENDILVCDLYGDYGLTPSRIGSLSPIGTYSTYSTASRLDNYIPMHAELFLDGERQMLARYPNEGYLFTEEPPQSDASSTHERKTLFLDSASSDRVAGWKTKEGVWAYGFFGYDWADESTPIEEFDAEKDIVTTKYPSFFGVKAGAPFYFYNCPEELDTYGEWYIDRERGLLAVFAPDGILSEDITLSLSTDNTVSIGADNVSLIGFNIEGSRASGIEVYGNGCSIKNCTVRGVGGNGIVVNGYSNEVSDCEVYSTGRGGISVSGGERATLAHSQNLVYNNLIHDFAEVYKTYQAGISLFGVGNVASHNEIHTSPHLAITYSGNENVIEYNLIHSVCLESDDAGAIYAGKSLSSYGNEIRYNCVFDIGSNGFSPNGIYLDDALSGQAVYSNLLVNIPGYAILVGGGRDNSILDNIIVNAKKAPLFYDARARDGALRQTWFSEDIPTILSDLEDSPWQSDVWQEAYPEYSELTFDKTSSGTPSYYANPANSTVRGNIIFDDDFTLGDVNGAVREYSKLERNLILPLFLVPVLIPDYNEGSYSPGNFLLWLSGTDIDYSKLNRIGLLSKKEKLQ